MENNRQIAIIGMAGRFPDARNMEELHQNLLSAKCSIKEISANRIQRTSLPANDEYNRAGYLENIDNFDHQLFNIPLGEAQCMDPHQRLLLETAYETIENAGYHPDQLSGSNTSVLVADKVLAYFRHADEFNTLLVNGNSSECMAAYVSRHFNLQGGAAVVDTSCSSSLTALHNACNDLILGDADLAMVCGVSVDLFPFLEKGYDLKVESPDGLSIPFSDQSNGMVYGEAAACILLKPLEKALVDGDHIHATILSTAVNNNANRSASLNAPDSVAQADVLQKAWKKAKIDPLDLGFIEAHGSGTRLGDSIEVGGLNLAFEPYTKEKSICPISTIKANIGHTRCLAGLAGLIKVVLSLKNEVIYPAYYTGTSSPVIDFKDASVYVNEQAIPWKRNHQRPRYAGVSSFGFSGANCHVVLGEAPENQPTPSADSTSCFIPISSQYSEGLLKTVEALKAKVSTMSSDQLLPLSKVLTTGRKQYDYRTGFVVKDWNDLKTQLEATAISLVQNPTLGKTILPKLILVFSDTDQISLEILDQWCTRLPIFAKVKASCETIREQLNQAATTAYYNLVFQQALAELLKHIGVPSKYLVGMGIGQVSCQIINKKLSLIEGIQKALAYSASPIENLETRAQRLIEKESTSGPAVFIAMNPGNAITQAIRQIAKDSELVQVFENQEREVLANYHQLLSLLYRHHFDLDLVAAMDYLKAPRIELPNYHFAPSRCWIKEGPSDLGRSEFQQTPSETPEAEPVLTPIQKKIAEVWREVLAVSKVTAGDDFFELGGDSLKATAVIQRLVKDFNLSLDFEDVFDYPQLNALATFVQESLSNAQKLLVAWKEVLKMESIGVDDDFFSIGGHSLLANQILNRIQHYFGQKLDFEDFFKYPTIRQMAQYLESKQQVDQSISLLPVQECYELSDAQKRLWVLCQFDESSVAYNELNTYLLEGDLRPDILERALAAVVDRHESLRTVFVERDGHTMQKILTSKQAGFQIDYTDFSHTADARKLADEYLYNFRLEPFDFEKGLLFQAKLFRLEKGQYLLGLKIHHIVFDDWSFEIMSREIMDFYQAFLEGQDSPFPPLPFQYKEIAAWMNQQLSGERLTELENYWLGKLQGNIPALELPTDFARPANKTYNGARMTLTIGSELTQKIREFSKTHSASVFMTLMAGLKTLFYRYSGQREIIVGMPVAGRGMLELENQVGFYTNTVALYTQFGADVTFADLMQIIKENMIEAYRHQLYPLNVLVEKLRLKTDLSRAPLFDILVVYKKVMNQGESKDYPIEIKIEVSEHAVSAFDMDLTIIEWSNRIDWMLYYNTDLYTPSTIQRIFKHFQDIMTAVLDSPQTLLKEIDYINAEEKKQLLEFSTKSDKENASSNFIINQLDYQAVVKAENLAVAIDQSHYTFHTLAQDTRRMASFIAEKIATPARHRVAILSQNKYQNLVASLASLRMGSAYLVLDATSPDTFLLQLLTDLKFDALLVDNPQVATRFSSLDFPVITLPESLKTLAIENRNWPSHPIQETVLVLEDSTSTNTPLMALNAATVKERLDWMWANLDFNEHTVLLQHADFDTGLAQLEVLATLLAGGTLVLDNSQDTIQHLELVETRGVTHLRIYPQRYTSFLERAIEGTEKVWNLKCVYAYLENISPDWQLLQNKLAQVQLWNLYGSAASGIIAAVQAAPVEGGQFVGNLLPNVSLCLLDDHHQLVPVGVWGKVLVVENNPPNNSDKEGWISVQMEQADLWCRPTEDLCRITGKGQLEWKGTDRGTAVVNGHRVSLSRLISLLEQNDFIKAAAINSQTAEWGTSLTAYVEMEPEKVQLFETDNWEAQLKARLATGLPQYLIPSHLVKVENLLYKVDGSIDMDALIVLEKQIEKNHLFELPSHETEKKLLKIWQGILGAEGIGINDNFFEIGGNSLLSLKITSTIYKDLGVKVTMTDIFQQPTIKKMARIIGGRSQEAFEKIPQIPQAENYVLSHAQRRMWILSHLGEGTATYNMYKTCKLEGTIDKDVLEIAFLKLINRQESLRTSVFTIGEDPRSQIASAAAVPFKLFYKDFQKNNDPLKMAEEECKRLAVRPFQLHQLPLFRVKLMQVAAKEYVFILVIHHIIADGWSVDILVNELFEIYESCIRGEEPALTPLTVQYKDYAAWENSNFEKHNFAKQQKFWKKTLSGDLPVLDLPFAAPRPSVQTYRGKSTEIYLGKELTIQLTELANKVQATPFMAMMSGILALFHRYTLQRDFIIGTPVAGREHPDFENQIGLFVNTLPLRNEVQAEWGFVQLLRQVKKNTLNAFVHQSYPFDKILDQIDLPKDTSRSPVFDVLVVWDDIGLEEKGIEERVALKVKDFPIENVLAKFDLTFQISQTNKGLGIGLSYNADLFLPEQIESFLVHLRQLIQSMVKDPQKAIAEVSYISEEEQKRLDYFSRLSDEDFEFLQTINQTDRPFPDQETFFNLFQKSVKTYPNHIAAVHNDREWTYTELHDKSIRLAKHLSERSVQKGDLVAVFCNRSIETLSALLALLRIGAVYVPLATDLPEKRLEKLIRDNGLKWVVTNTSTTEKRPELVGTKNTFLDLIPIFWIDQLWEEKPKEENLSTLPEVLPTDLAYIIFTSGSTGQPKGAMIEHVGMINHLYSKINELTMDDSTILVQNASQSFDISIWQFLSPLLTGGQTLIYDSEIINDLVSFIEKINLDRPTILELVPSYLSVLLDYQNDWAPFSLRYLAMTGEALKYNLVKRWFETNYTPLVNYYGPTEASDDITSIIIDHCPTEELIPIGKPVQNMRIYIVDEEGKICPTGEKGEILVSGIGVGRGYLNDSEKTAASFLTDVYREEKNVRMYKTGDMGYFLPDGNIQFSGRKDHQVKVSGHRIELGEIDNAIAKITGIKEAVVDVVERDGVKMLCAYFQKESSQNPIDSEQIRNNLQNVLPSYMVPNFFVLLDAFPLTPHGKIDRKELPHPDLLQVGNNRQQIPSGEVKNIGEQDRILADAYWQKYLEAYDNVASFALLGKQQKTKESSTLRYAQKLPTALSAIFLTTCRQWEISSEVFLSTVWGLLLAHYNNSDDVVFGRTVCLQSTPDEPCKKTLNTIPQRVRYSRQETFRDLIEKQAREYLEGTTHQHFSLKNIEERFQKNIVDHDFLILHLISEKSNDEQLAYATDMAPGNLRVKATIDKQICLEFSYSDCLFQQNQLERMVHHFETILEKVINLPNTPLCQLDFRTQEEMAFIHQINQTDVPLKPETVLDLLHQQVQLRPDALAVKYKETQWSYQELDHYSNYIAHYLIDTYAIGKESIIALRIERSEKALALMIGILKTGASYLFVDKSFPEQRLRFILQDSKTPLLFVDSEDLLLSDFSGTLINANKMEWKQERESPVVKIAPEDVMYTIYTSGSTGQPKGVQIKHQSLYNYICYNQQRFQISAEDQIFLLSSLAFDLSYTCIWGPMVSGGQLVIFPESDMLDTRRLLTVLEEESITILKLTPTSFDLLVNDPHFVQVAPSLKLRLIILGGEKIRLADIQTFKKQISKEVVFIDEYGPTETTVGVTQYQLREIDWTSDGSTIEGTNIGQPIANHQIHIINRFDQEIGLGILGEICISGIGLAVGYLNQAELTLQKFGTHPNDPQLRIYRTGDLGRWLPDGNIEYLGRNDHQLKIKGYRIEPGEIETIIRQHDTVKDVLVLPYKTDNRTLLIAYLLVNEEGAIEAIKPYLQNLLPAFMIPHFFIKMEHFPQLANGKTDRQSFPLPDLSQLTASTSNAVESKLPATSDEKIILLINTLEKVIKIRPIRYDHNFFFLGGDSILAIQLVAQLNQSGYKLKVMDVFNYPVVEQLAQRLEPLKQLADQGLIEGHFPLSPIQRYFLQSPRKNLHHYNQALMIFSRQGFDQRALQKALNHLLLHHDALRLTFTQGPEGNWVQHNMGGKVQVELEVIDLRKSKDVLKERTALAEKIQSSLVLHQAPLLKAVLFQEADGDRLLLVVHHLLIDGISWRIILEDLQEGYQKLIQEKPLKLPTKTDSFKSWCEGLEIFAKEPAFEDEIDYWQEIVAVPVVPLQRQPNTNGMASLQKMSFQLSPKLTKLLVEEVHEAYTTEVNEILLAALARAFHDTFDVDKVWIMLEGHGREEILADLQFSRTVGWFTSMFPVLLENKKGDSSIAQTVIGTKDYLRKIPRKGVGYGIARYLRPELWEAENTFSTDVVFNFLGQFSRENETEENWQVTNNHTGADHNTDDLPDFPIEISGVIADGQLVLTIRYDGRQFGTLQIQKLSKHYQQALEEIILHCTSVEETVKTSSDFSYKELAMEDLDELFD